MSATVYCPACQASAVNGHPVHEAGCEHEGESWVTRGRHTKVVLPRSAEVPEWVNEKQDA